MIVVIFNDLEGAWLAEALRYAFQEARLSGLRPPVPFVELAAKLVEAAKTVQGDTPFLDLAAMADTRNMTMMLTLDEAADELRVSLSSAKRLVRTGQLATVKVGGATRVTRAALEAYVANLSPRPFGERIETKNGARP